MPQTHSSRMERLNALESLLLQGFGSNDIMQTKVAGGRGVHFLDRYSCPPRLACSLLKLWENVLVGCFHSSSVLNICFIHHEIALTKMAGGRGGHFCESEWGSAKCAPLPPATFASKCVPGFKCVISATRTPFSRSSRNSYWESRNTCIRCVSCFFQTLSEGALISPSTTKRSARTFFNKPNSSAAGLTYNAATPPPLATL